MALRQTDVCVHFDSRVQPSDTAFEQEPFNLCDELGAKDAGLK